jgi:hypothetical protein
LRRTHQPLRPPFPRGRQCGTNPEKESVKCGPRPNQLDQVSDKEALARGPSRIPLQGERNMASSARQPAQSGTLAPGMRLPGRASRTPRGRHILAVLALTVSISISPSSCAIAGAKATPNGGTYSRTSAKSRAMPPGDGDKSGLDEGLGMEILRLSGGSGISDGHRERLVSTRRVPGSFGGRGGGGARGGGGGKGGELQVGSKVRVKGLRGAKEYNGMLGIVTAKVKGRFSVEVAGLTEELVLKADNLENLGLDRRYAAAYSTAAEDPLPSSPSLPPKEVEKYVTVEKKLLFTRVPRPVVYRVKESSLYKAAKVKQAARAHEEIAQEPTAETEAVLEAGGEGGSFKEVAGEAGEGSVPVTAGAGSIVNESKSEATTVDDAVGAADAPLHASGFAAGGDGEAFAGPVVYEGWLWSKEVSTTRIWHKRWCVARPGMLQVIDKDEDGASERGAAPRIVKTVQLAGCR